MSVKIVEPCESTSIMCFCMHISFPGEGVGNKKDGVNSKGIVLVDMRSLDGAEIDRMIKWLNKGELRRLMIPSTEYISCIFF
jgi:hypothetical protein